MSFLFKQIVTRCCRKKKSDVVQPYMLTELEKQILEEISMGKSYVTVADELSLSKDEVKKHVRSIYEKLHNRTKEKK